MNKNIYLVTDPRPNLFAIIEAYAKLGIGFIQYRDKKVDDKTFVANANKIAKIARKYKIKFIINDRTHLLEQIDCDGFHVGQSDGDHITIRRKYPHLHMGVSVKTVEHARKAIESGADLIGTGTFAKSKTKPESSVISFSEVDAINKITKKVVAIGGINPTILKRIPKHLYQYVASVSYLLDAPNPKLALAKLQAAIRN